MWYNFVGYVHYSSQIIFLVAHWLFGFVYLYTALNLGYQLQIDQRLTEYQESSGTLILTKR